MTNEEAVKILKNEYLCRINIKDGCYPWKCKSCEYSENYYDVTQAINYAVQALSKQCSISEQADQRGNNTEMVDQFREDTKKTDSERVSLSEQEKSNSFPEEPPAEGNFEMNCSDAPDIRVGKIPYKKPEVICCKDCRYRDPEDKKCDHGHGIVWQLPRPDDWFCADGKR